MVALEGFAKMYNHNWKEELSHAQKLIEYGLLRGSRVNTPDVAKPNDNKWYSMNACQILNYTLNLEMQVNENLLKG
jgi:ferritin